MKKRQGNLNSSKQLVGILNCTPDSYFETGRFTDPQEAIEYGLHLFEEGADVVDIGGESTHPGIYASVSEEEEMRRVLPVIRGIRAKTDRPLSIDTYKPSVANAALAEGVDWINDITGFKNPRMRTLAQKSGALCCVMHMYGEPHTIGTPSYPQGIIEEILSFFQRQIALLLESGVSPSQIILDPGIGGGSFGKSVEESLQIIKHLKRLSSLGYPVLVSLSRKSFQQKILQKPASEVLSTTLALNTIALLEGAAYIRVHDVAQHRSLFTLLERFEAVI